MYEQLLTSSTDEQQATLDDISVNDYLALKEHCNQELQSCRARIQAASVEGEAALSRERERERRMVDLYRSLAELGAV
jgi:hypothetical protein